MTAEVEIALLIVVVVAACGFIGTVLWRIMRTQETIVRYLSERADAPTPALGPTITPKPRSFDAMRKELEERRRIAADQDED
jgi:hypothetical protein